MNILLLYLIEQLKGKGIKTVLSITTCQQTGLQEHLKAATYFSRVKHGNFLNFLQMGAFDKLKWNYDGAFEWRFGSGRGDLNNFFQKCQLPWGMTWGGYPWGILKL